MMVCCEKCCKCSCNEYGKGPKAYRLEKDIPGLPKGTIFVMVPSKDIGADTRSEWLVNAWVNGNCQSNWVAGIFRFPDTVIEDKTFFTRIYNLSSFFFKRE